MTRSLHCLMGVLLGAAFVTAGAQSLRDPTLPPAEAAVAGAPAGASTFGFDSSATAVIVRNGRSYLAVGTRLYAPGEKLGQARIERISDERTTTKPQKTFLMRKPREFYEEDKGKEQARIKAHEQAIQRGEVRNAEGQSEPGMYVPAGGMKIDHGRS